MTTPVGSVRITAEADAGEFGDDLVRVVKEAMREVVREVLRQMRDVNGALGDVNTTGFTELHRAAQAAARALDDTADAAREAARAVNGLDPGGLRGIQRACGETHDCLRGLDRDARRAASAMAGGFGTVAASLRTAGASAALLGGPLLAAAGAASALGGAAAGVAAVAAPAFAVVKLGMDGIKAAAANAQDSLDAVKSAVSSTFEQELSGTFDQLGVFLEGFTDELQGVASSLSGLFTGVADTLMSNGPAIENLLGNTQVFLDQLGPGLNSLTEGLVSFASAASEAAAPLGQAFSGLFSGIGDELNRLADDGTITAWAESGAAAIAGLGDLVGPAVNLFVQLGTVMGDELGSIFSTLGTVIRDITPNLTAIGEAFLQAFDAALPGIGTLITGFTDILAAVSPILPVIGELAGIIGGALGLAMSELAPSFERVATALTDALEPVLPVIGELFERLAPIIGDIGEILADILVPVIEVFGELLAQLLPALEPLIEAFGVLVEAVQPLIEQIIDAVMPAIEALIPPITDIATVIGEVLAEAITFVVENILPLLVEAIEFLTPIITTLGETVGAVFSFIAEAIQLAWDGVISPVLNFIVALVRDVLAPTFLFLWENVVQPVWDGIGAVISGVWSGVISPVFEVLKAGVGLIGEAFSSAWNSVIKPVWDALGAGITFVIDSVIKPAWEGMKSALGSVRDFFSDVVGGIGRAWDGMKSLLAKPINFMIGTVWNSGILKAWNVVADFLPGLDPAAPLSLIPEHATGGRIRGPGSGTSDDVLMWGSNGEHMVTALEVIRAGGHEVLYAIRDMIAKGVPFAWDNGKIVRDLGLENLQNYGAAVARLGYGKVSDEGLFSGLVRDAADKAQLKDRWRTLLPGFATGGAVFTEPWMEQLKRGHDFARAHSGQPYVWGGSPIDGGSDCSGWVSGIEDVILGGIGKRRWATMGMPTGNYAGGLAAAFSVGVTDAGVGHTAGTLGEIPGYGATNIESGGGHGYASYGGPAVGADHGQFEKKFHLTIGPDGGFIGGDQPSPGLMRQVIADIVNKVLSKILDPVKEGITGAIGAPPPELLGIPPRALDNGREHVSEFLADLVANLSEGLFGVFKAAKAAVFDTGGILPAGGAAVNFSGRPERILSPEQTAAFDKLIAFITGSQVAVDWGGLEELVRTGIDIYRTESQRNREQSEQTAKTTKELNATLGGGSGSGGLSLGKAAAGLDEAVRDMMSVLDTSALFDARTITLTAQEVRQKQIEEWKAFLEQLRKHSEEHDSKQTSSTGSTTKKTFDFGGVINGPGLFASGTVLPERVLSPRQTEAFERLVAAIAGPMLGVPDLRGPDGLSHQMGPRMTAGDMVFNFPEARRPEQAAKAVENRLLSLLDR